VFEQMARRRSRFGGGLYTFINWYWPVFNGHAFVLARANEYEADECSVRLAGADVAASALMRFPVNNRLLNEKFWPDIYSRANNEKEAPQEVMMELNRVLKSSPAVDDAGRWLRQSFLMATNNADTHPCLKDRLRAIGRLPTGIDQGQIPVPQPPASTADEQFLGSFAATAVRQISNDWRKVIERQWAARYEQAQKIASELAAVNVTEPSQITTAQVWEKARKIVELKGDEAAVTTLEQVIALEPKHAAANFILGRHHLSKDDSRGVQFIEVAMRHDPDLTASCCELLHTYFNRTGQHDKLRSLEKTFDEHQRRMALSQRGRIEIFPNDTFIYHELTEEQLVAFEKIFEAEPEIGSVAIVKKEFAFDPNIICYVVAIKPKGWLRGLRKNIDRELPERIHSKLGLPGHVFVFLSKTEKVLSANIFGVYGALIYKR
jgi:hypothetical protein